MSDFEKDLTKDDEPVFELPEDYDPAPVGSEELDWIEAHGFEIAKQYAEQWIAVKDNAIVAHGADIREVRVQLDEQNIKSPMLMWIPPYDEDPPILAL